MRNRRAALIIRTSLLVAIMAAGLTVALTPSSADNLQPPKKAAQAWTHSTPTAATAPAILEDYSVAEYLSGMQWLGAVQTADATIAASVPTPTTAPSTPSSGGGDAPGGVLACIRNAESGGDYTVYNSGGSGASGAYQFMPGTWAHAVALAGDPQYAGEPAADAPPGVQDAAAQALYAEDGTSPWAGDPCVG